jgi:hypothetical protein
MKLLIMQFSPTTYHLLSLWSKYSALSPSSRSEVYDQQGGGGENQEEGCHRSDACAHTYIYCGVIAPCRR